MKPLDEIEARAKVAIEEQKFFSDPNERCRLNDNLRLCDALRVAMHHMDQDTTMRTLLNDQIERILEGGDE